MTKYSSTTVGCVNTQRFSDDYFVLGMIIYLILLDYLTKYKHNAKFYCRI